jgi:hypothetical protein
MRIEDKLNKLKIKFKKITLQDKKLKKYYEGKNVKYESIVVASAIVGGIDLRNCINNTKEKYPYNRKELKIIDKFHKLEKNFLEVK